MRLDAQKELTPVLYGDSAVKVLPKTVLAAHELGFVMHWHERMELIRVYEGELALDLGDQRLTVRAGQAAVFGPGQPHHGRAGASGVGYHTVMFDPTHFLCGSAASKRYLEPVVQQRALFGPVTGDERVLSALDALIAADAADDGGCGCLAAVGCVWQLLGALYAACYRGSATRAVVDDRLRNVLEEINAHFAGELTRASLCRRFGYDEAYFCRRFRAVTGLPPMRYIRILRLEKAWQLLCGGRQGIGEVAAACGFADPSYFTRCFRAHYGLTPTALQAQQDAPGENRDRA